MLVPDEMSQVEMSSSNWDALWNMVLNFVTRDVSHARKPRPRKAVAS